MCHPSTFRSELISEAVVLRHSCATLRALQASDQPRHISTDVLFQHRVWSEWPRSQSSQQELPTTSSVGVKLHGCWFSLPVFFWAVLSNYAGTALLQVTIFRDLFNTLTVPFAGWESCLTKQGPSPCLLFSFLRGPSLLIPAFSLLLNSRESGSSISKGRLSLSLVEIPKPKKFNTLSFSHLYRRTRNQWPVEAAQVTCQTQITHVS